MGQEHFAVKTMLLRMLNGIGKRLFFCFLCNVCHDKGIAGNLCIVNNHNRFHEHVDVAFYTPVMFFDCLSEHNDVQILYNNDNIQIGYPVPVAHDQYKIAVLLIYRPGSVPLTGAFLKSLRLTCK